MAANTEHEQVRKRNLALRVALYVGAFIGGLLAVVLLINSYDPELDPRASAAMHAAPSPVPDAENAYFVLYGLGVAEGQDPHAHGVRFVAANNGWMQALDAGQPADRSNVEALAKQNDAVPWRGGATKNLCGEQRVGCLSVYIKNRSQVEKLVRDNQLRLTRYRSLYRYKQFREASLNRVTLNWLPNYAGAEHETVLAQIVLKAVDGNVEGALRDLAIDSAYWRRVLAGASTLVSKSLAANFLIRNYVLASEIAAKYRDRPAVAENLTEMMRPLTAEERNWKGVLMGEFQWVAYLYASLSDHGGEYGFFSQEKHFWDRALAVLFYKPNATVNMKYRYFEKVLVLTDAPAHALVDSARQVSANIGEITNPFRVGIVYNPVGKILVAIAAVSPEGYARYVARTHNLDGTMRLLRLQMDIYGKKVAMKDVGSHLNKSPADLFDPYTDKPFRWEPTSRELWFEGVNPMSEKDKTTKQRIGVRI